MAHEVRGQGYDRPSLRLLVSAASAVLGIGLGVSACEDGASLQGSPLGEPEQRAEPNHPVDYECAPMPSSCPSEVPSYQLEIADIVERHCGNCHLESDREGPWPFASRQDIFDWQSSIRSALELCLMPPPSSDAPLSASERERLQSWLACGAPDN